MRKSEWLVRPLAQIGQERGEQWASGSRSRLPADDMSDLCIPSVDTQAAGQEKHDLDCSSPAAAELLERYFIRSAVHLDHGVFRANQIGP
jgi:hypothetical protein